MTREIKCPICEYKKIKNNRLVIGDFIEEGWIENYFPSLNLDFEKISERDEKTPDGYILNNGEKIVLSEIKFLDYSEQELKYSANKGEYLHREFPDKRLKREISRAKDQLKTIEFNGPKVIYFITRSHEIDLQSLREAILGEQWVKINEGGDVLYQGHSGFKDKNRNRFVDGFLTAVFVFCCNPYNKHKIWLFENKKSKDRLPPQLLDAKHIVSHDIYRPIIKERDTRK